MINLFYKFRPSQIKYWLIRRIFHSALSKFDSLKKEERYHAGEIELKGHIWKYLDGPSFYFMYNEIFNHKVYDFKSDKQNPVIIDAGANVGLSTIYFKQTYPGADVIAFEPDSKIFRVLKENISLHEIHDIQLENRALWKEEGELFFDSEGADAGRISTTPQNKIKVSATVLSKYLHQHVDFLKMDIEGAEFEVLRECESRLKNVDKLFVEYHNFTKEPQRLGEILEILKKAGFKYYISNPGIHHTNPFIHTKEYLGMDFQLNIHARRYEYSPS